MLIIAPDIRDNILIVHDTNSNLIACTKARQVCSNESSFASLRRGEFFHNIIVHYTHESTHAFDSVSVALLKNALEKSSGSIEASGQTTGANLGRPKLGRTTHEEFYDTFRTDCD